MSSADAAERYPELWTARRSDLCYATTNRQDAVSRLAERCDLVLVVGSENSSNTQALVRVARNAGVTAERVDGPDAVDPTWLAGIETVGVTAGASAPDSRVRAVIDAIAPSEGVDSLRLTEEDEYFPLPPSLRRLATTLQALIEGSVACRTPGRPGPVEQDRDWGATEALELLAV